MSTHLSATAEDLENDVEVAAKIRNQAQLGEFTSRVRVIEGYYNLDTGKVEWTADRRGPLDWSSPRIKHDAVFRSPLTRIRFHRAEG